MLHTCLDFLICFILSLSQLCIYGHGYHCKSSFSVLYSQLEQESHASTWFLASTWTRNIHMVYSISMCQGPTVNLLWQHGRVDINTTPVKAWPQTSTASGRSMDHGGVLWRPNPVNEPFFNSNILSLLWARAIVGLGSLLGAESAQAPGFCTPPCLDSWVTTCFSPCSLLSHLSQLPSL